MTSLKTKEDKFLNVDNLWIRVSHVTERTEEYTTVVTV